MESVINIIIYIILIDYAFVIVYDMVTFFSSLKNYSLPTKLHQNTNFDYVWRTLSATGMWWSVDEARMNSGFAFFVMC